jgi:magnesium transporter
MSSGIFITFRRYQYDNVLFSDWIAHGILDSVVDSFFPILQHIEQEVISIENMVLTSGEQLGPFSQAFSTSIDPSPNLGLPSASFPAGEKDENSPQGDGRKNQPPMKTRFLLPSITISLVLRRLKRVASRGLRTMSRAEANAQPVVTSTPLMSMARTRRLVTSLARLLHTKSEVISQIRKRLLDPKQFAFGNPLGIEEDGSVAIYMGDIQGAIYSKQSMNRLFMRCNVSRRPYIYSTASISPLRAYIEPVTPYLH